jgi:putative transposase
MCKALNLSRSGYYAWLRRRESKRRQADRILLKEIKRVHRESYKTYGIRRVTKHLNKDDVLCGKSRVGRLMRENQIYSRLRKRYKATTNSNHNYPVAPNLLAQNFESEKSNQKYVGDITYVWAEECRLYVSAIEDLFNRELIGWCIAQKNESWDYRCSDENGNWQKSFRRRFDISFGQRKSICSKRI